MLPVLGSAILGELTGSVTSVVAPQHRRRLRLPVIALAVVGVAAATGVLSAQLLRPHRVTTVVDATLRDHDRVWVATGTPPTVVRLTFEELVELTGGELVPVAPEE